MPLSHYFYQDHLRGKKWFGDDAELLFGEEHINTKVFYFPITLLAFVLNDPISESFPLVLASLITLQHILVSTNFNQF